MTKLKFYVIINYKINQKLKVEKTFIKSFEKSIDKLKKMWYNIGTVKERRIDYDSIKKTVKRTS